MTADSIKVGLTVGIGSPSEVVRVEQDLQNFFNGFFELYGRRLDVFDISGPSGNGNTCQQREADADALAEEGFFAANNGGGNSDGCFEAELWRDHVISPDGGGPSSVLAANAPYAWGYEMAGNNQLANMGRFVCTQLAGHRARYSPEATLAAEPRKFGLVIQYDQTPYPPSPQPLTDQLARCGVQLAYQTSMEAQETSQPGGAGAAVAGLAGPSASAVEEMQAHGVTTVLVMSGPFLEQYLPSAADSQHYYPEWVLLGDPENWLIKAFWPQADQRQSLLGLAADPAQVPYSDEPLNWALNAVDPGYQLDSSSELFSQANAAYHALLLIASGIQMAGPYLTPSTFQAGLQAASFPNPFSPEMEGVAGFGSGRHSMTKDVSLMWWDDGATSPYPDEGTGAWCYADGARRFDLADWPGTPVPLIGSPCHTSPPGT